MDQIRKADPRLLHCEYRQRQEGDESNSEGPGTDLHFCL